MACAALNRMLFRAGQPFAVLPADWSKLLAFRFGGAVGLLTPYAHLRARTCWRGIPCLAPAAKLGDGESSLGLESVLAIVSQMGHGTAAADTPLLEAGLDSLGALELRNQLAKARIEFRLSRL